MDELRPLREELLDARENLCWTAAFPEQVPSFGLRTQAALGLRGPIQTTLGTTALVEYEALIRALEADAHAIAEAFSEEQARQLGTAAPRSPEREALWDSDPAAQEYKRAQLERARQLAEWHDPATLAAEARDYRP